ncbi:hypothetical protein L2E82_25658 [Cichorium intybus]|uniref:Uncharacterized protein n=1 Tax=Cichorium intybus TaxID=13427 RepID=A0ACB9E453_CICIN|nr:hypothetical protein L2E82_25658 [Cichorium intybus]
MHEKSLDESRRRENVTFAEVVKGINPRGERINTQTNGHITKAHKHSPLEEGTKQMVIEMDKVATESRGRKLLAEVKSFKSLQCLFNLCRGEEVRNNLIKYIISDNMEIVINQRSFKIWIKEVEDRMFDEVERTQIQRENAPEQAISSDGEQTTGDDWTEETSDEDYDEACGESIFRESSPEIEHYKNCTREQDAELQKESYTTEDYSKAKQNQELQLYTERKQTKAMEDERRTEERSIVGLSGKMKLLLSRNTSVDP